MEIPIQPGDIGTGDVVVLPDSEEEILVKTVRLGQGGFVLTVSPADDYSPEAERLIVLTAGTLLRKRRRVSGW